MQIRRGTAAGDESAAPGARGWSVLRVAGELDVVGAPELRQAAQQMLGEGHRRLLLDLSGVDFVDSFGLGVLIGILKRVRLLDGELCLAIPERRVRRVLELCDLDRVFDIRLSVDDAPVSDVSAVGS